MKINWKRVLIIGFASHLLLVAIYLLTMWYAGSALSIIIPLDWFVLMFLGGIWVTRKIESNFILHGVLIAILSNILYLVTVFGLGVKLPSGFWTGAFESFAIKIAGGAVGAYVGGIRRKKLQRVPVK